MLKYFRMLICFMLLIYLTISPASAREKANELQFGWKLVLSELVNIKNVKVHQEMLQYIADQNNGHRAAGTSGSEATAQYIAFLLKLGNLDVEVQEFEFPFYQELSVPTFEQIAPHPTVYPPAYAPSETDGFRTSIFSGSGDAVGLMQPVDVMIPPPETPNASNSGCEADDFAGFTAGNIALIQRGDCTFYEKAFNAQNAGAAAVIIFNEGQPGRQNVAGTSLGVSVQIPVIFTTFAIGEELAGLAKSGDVTIRVKTETIAETRMAKNVIASTRSGDESNTIVIGAHIDSVPVGPGINDNGSGTSAVLETAMKTGWFLRNPKHKIVFAFWGEEELNLVGSSYWLNNLTPEKKANIRAYLNFDMIASPNYVRFVLDGDGSNGGPVGPAGSGAIEQFFVDYFNDNQLATDPTPIAARFDYIVFMFSGIPIGGLFTGELGIKTEEQAAVYGGEAGKNYDENYHTPHDTIDKINYEVEEQMLKAIAASVQHFSENSLPVAAPSALKVQSSPTAQTSEFDYFGSNLLK